MVTYQHGYEFAMPIPLHAQSDGALAAVATVRRLGAERTLERMVNGWEDGRGERVGGLVTKHGRPRASTWEGDPVSRNARSILADALAGGFTAHMLVVGDQCVVEGYRLDPEKIGFRASWLRGGAAGFAWCTPWRYELVEDQRPIGIDQKAKTGKVGFRGAGMGTTRLGIVGSPWGLPVSWAELQRRVRAADAVAS